MFLTSRASKGVPTVCHVRVDDDGDFNDDLDDHDPLPQTHTFTLAHAIMYTVYNTHLHKHKHLYSVYTQIHKLVQTNTLAPEEMHLPTTNAHQDTFSQTHKKEHTVTQSHSLP